MGNLNKDKRRTEGRGEQCKRARVAKGQDRKQKRRREGRRKYLGLQKKHEVNCLYP